MNHSSTYSSLEAFDDGYPNSMIVLDLNSSTSNRASMHFDSNSMRSAFYIEFEHASNTQKE